jgi:glycerol-3-phosphate acyltransferase PlsX
MIAVDAMGGDFAPVIAVRGAFNAAKKGVAVKLFGQEPIISSLLDEFDSNWEKLPISIVHCTETIGMAEEPSRAIFKKKNSSLLKAIQSVAHQDCSAFVSAGHSGAILVSSVISLGKVEGITRPALGTFLPTKNGSVFCLDLGANTDCKPEFLYQFAVMGNCYVQLTKGIEHPRVALLSNGAERYKGSQLIKETYTLLEQSSLRFMGNIESKEIFNNYADVIVCEGFSGNVMLKAIQGTVSSMKIWMQQEFQRDLIGKVAGLLSRHVFKRLSKKIDYSQHGGALLLGVNAPVIVAHGSSDAIALENAILNAHTIVNEAIVSRFNFSLAEILQQDKTSDKIDMVTQPKERVAHHD